MRPLGRGREVAPGIRIIGHLARSHVLDVYDAWCATRGCRVVVKTLRPDRLRDGAARRRLLREGALLRRLQHPHLVRGYAVVEEPRPLVVMETLVGRTLARMVDDEEPLTDVEAALLGLQLGSAVSYLHGEGLLHLDLKPSNVVAEPARAKLIDLSVARAPGVLRPGIGTWCYLAPEQARGGEVGPAADVWGLALVLFETLAGEAVWEDDLGVEYPQLVERAPRVRAWCPGVARELADVLDGALEPAAEDRPALSEMLAVFERVAGLPEEERWWGAAGRPPAAAPGAAASGVAVSARGIAS